MGRGRSLSHPRTSWAHLAARLVIFAPFLFGRFLLSLLGVLGGLKDPSVRQHNPAANPRRWRNGS